MSDDARARIFVGDIEVDAVPPNDRGLAYGDGVFETMRAFGGSVPWWARHWQRLTRGIDLLGIKAPDEVRVREAAESLLEGCDSVVKLIVTRGIGTRGYGPSPSQPTWIVSRHPVPKHVEAITLRWCHLRLAEQPALAGIKHCNRLEQVLARAEWLHLPPDEMYADDGLMLDSQGHVVGATAGNVFALRNGHWVTPPLDRCGVRGVCREWMLAEPGAAEARLAPSDIRSADAIFVCNAVRGILPVARLGDRTWSPHPQVARLRARLAEANPAFAPMESP